MSGLAVAGFEMFEQALASEHREALLELIYSAAEQPTVLRRLGNARYAARGLLWGLPTLAGRLTAYGVDALASRLLDADAFAIDAILFDKHAEVNWSVPAHQDRIMPVANTEQQRCRVRAGVTYGQPSVATLNSMLALRLHFDLTDERTGALQMVPGSHEQGVWREQDLRGLANERFELARAQPGDVLAMKPLVVHRSRSGTAPARRRVLHVVYASAQPECGLRWRATA